MADDKHKNADFIGHVVGDAKNPQETRMLTGWFGDSEEDGYRRLYTDAELSSYVDIPDDAILHTEPLKDVQPSGGVIVWIKRDAALKPGGSAASRAARFLQGQVQQDFASAGAAGSLEKAGLRCVTVVPCGEPTGFTGQCTKQPEVGGAWPCITAIPHCFEVTGFTGKCTHAPWPNPTRYIGCTHLHCPTHDLTHIPHICNIVASGNPGCVVINPPQGGDPAQKVGAAADAEAKPLPETEIPGCGYTKSWGVCETHLLGCGYTKDWGNQCPTQLPDCPTAAPGCGLSRNPVCTDLPGCNWTKQPAICHQTVSQGMVPCTGPLPVDAVGAPGGGAGQPASAICATAIACDITLFCHTRFQVQCFHSLVCVTQPQQCFPIPSPFCPVTPGCPFGPGGGGTPVQGGGGFAAFGAAAAVVPNTQAPGCLVSGVVICPTSVHGCTVPPTSPDFGCTKSGPACPTTPPACIQTQPQTQCTQSGPQCPTSCGPDCQSQQPNCTSIGQACGHNPCTIDPIQCHTPGFECTMICTHLIPQCPAPTPPPVCNNPNVGAQAFAARAVGPQPLPLTHVGCPASDFVACSQFGGCQTIPNGDCTFFGGCASLPQQFAAAGPGGGCTQSGPLCPTHAKPQCTFAGPACPPTPATICTQFAPCPTHQKPCHTPGFECTMFCTQGAPGCPHTIQVAACPITVTGPQCPVHSGFNCPSAIACQSIACQPGGGGEQQAFPRQAHVPVPQQTLAILCTQTGPQCPQTQQGCTQFGALCPPPSQQGFCPPVTSGGPQCPPVSGTFRCPSALCQSIACQSVACQPGGGGQQQFAFAPQAVGAPQTLATVCTQFGAQCPHTAGCPSPGIDCTAILCTHVGPHCPNTAATVCTQSGPQCPHTHGCPTPGIDCTVLCTHVGVNCPNTHATVCTQLCTQAGPQCPHTHGCPTPGIDCTVLCTHVGVNCPNTHATVCTQLCTQAGPQCPHTHGCPTPGIDCTVLCTHIGANCPNTAATVCTQSGPQCPPHQTLQGQLCPITVGGPQCPPASGFNCPSQLGCQSIACGQSIACVSAACNPGGGGGGQQAFGAVLHPYTPMHQCFSPLFNCPTTPCTGVQCFHTSIGCIQ